MVTSPWRNDFDRKGLFRNSRWFTRGWTLQELIAPHTVEFYAEDWTEIGTKRSLKTRLAAITGIDIRVLGGESPAICNAAERMSWAARRRTTRTEDSAYCLLGIFDVNIPLIYGEGQKAMDRLQQEILNTTDDDTLLAWGLNDENTVMFDSGASRALSALEVFKAIKDQIITKLGGRITMNPLAQDISGFRAATKSKWHYAQLERLQQKFIKNVDPPTMTRRGLQSVLYVRDCGDGIFLACVNSRLNSNLVCICLSQAGESTSIFSRLGGTGLASWFSLVPFDAIKHFEQRTIIISRADNRTSSFCHDPRKIGRDHHLLFRGIERLFTVNMKTVGKGAVFNRAFINKTLATEGLEFFDFVYARCGSDEPVVVILGNYWGKVIPISERLFQTPSGSLYINKTPTFRSSAADQVCQAVASRYPSPREVMDRLIMYFQSYAISVSWRTLRTPYRGDHVVVELESWETTSDFRFSASSLLEG